VSLRNVSPIAQSSFADGGVSKYLLHGSFVRCGLTFEAQDARTLSNAWHVIVHDPHFMRACQRTQYKVVESINVT